MLTTMKGEIDSNTIRVEDFNTPLTPIQTDYTIHPTDWMITDHPNRK